ncbi:hypothetical protein PHET_11639 [Paragonimus heterotremus]|uniref:Uncharacterized protein n=1 Tax=Paragonimus heterotremus TaxID=100268 RepID=A0A8J4T8V0_9TREM|nr:hypothetical protein PHET_11639 [Paragonimus heterotremus]
MYFTFFRLTDYQYEDFVGHSKMLPIMQRAVWLHIDLPGQGDGEEELPSRWVLNIPRNYQYEDFAGHSKMLPIMQRAVWLHIDLPGQGDGEEELPSRLDRNILSSQLCFLLCLTSCLYNVC